MRFLLFFCLSVWMSMGSLWAADQGLPGPEDIPPTQDNGYDEDGYNDTEDDGYTEEEEDMDDEPPVAEKPVTRGGFSVNGLQDRGPKRLVTPEPRQYVEEKPWQSPPVAPVESAQSLTPNREHPPVEKELAFGQTDWNQIDLHSLTRNRIDRS